MRRRKSIWIFDSLAFKLDNPPPCGECWGGDELSERQIECPRGGRLQGFRGHIAILDICWAQNDQLVERKQDYKASKSMVKDQDVLRKVDSCRIYAIFLGKFENSLLVDGLNIGVDDKVDRVNDKTDEKSRRQNWLYIVTGGSHAFFVLNEGHYTVKREAQSIDEHL